LLGGWAGLPQDHKQKQNSLLLLFEGEGTSLFGGQYLKTKAKTNPPIQLYKEPGMEWTLGIVQNNGPLYIFNLFLIIVLCAR
jgi:hypothetical protein